MSTSFVDRRCLVILALVLGAGAACDPFGIAPTVADSDGDGVADAVDNCVDVPNPTQFDSDGDGLGDACSTCNTPLGIDLDADGYDDRCDLCIGIGELGSDADGDGIDDGCDPCVGRRGTTGVDRLPADNIDDGCSFCREPAGADVDQDGLDDACDPCLAGPPHDEDGDGRDDGCDNCPADANADQAAVDDTDEVGDACDPDLQEAHTRPLFDPFVHEIVGLWTATGTWTLRDDAVHVDSPSADATYQTTRAVTQATFSVRTRLAGAPIGDKAFAAIELRAGAATVACRLDADGTLIFDGPSTGMMTGVPLDRPVELELTRPPAQLIAVARCIARPDGGTPIQVELPAFGEAWEIGLRARGQVVFEWIDAVTGPITPG